MVVEVSVPRAAAAAAAAAVVSTVPAAPEKSGPETANRRAGRTNLREQAKGLCLGPLVPLSAPLARTSTGALWSWWGVACGNCSLRKSTIAAAAAAAGVAAKVMAVMPSKRSTDKSSASTALTGLCGTRWKKEKKTRIGHLKGLKANQRNKWF